MKILVAGGGTAGLISAIILKKFLNCQVDIVKSDKIGIVGVGEGSTEHFKEFLTFSGISQYSIINECGATYKAGILFKNFSSNDFLHSVSYPFDSKLAQYNYVYGKQIGENDPYLYPSHIIKNRIPLWFIGKEDSLPFNQFHFNTFKLNSFLINFSKSIGISVYDDEIIDVLLNDKGEINCVVGEKKKYSYDFYIDATGFKRILLSKMGAKWVSFSKYMKMNSAITFATEETEEYNLWTIAQGMSSGWMFRLPVQDRYGNGYIYDKNYINEEEAKLEAEKYFGRELEIGKSFSFDPGALDKAWIKNCVGIGLSSVFVEPLEASSIGSSIQQSFLLMHKISNYDKKIIDSYNKSFTDIVNNIRDFIVLHYISDRRDTEFWIDVSKIEIPSSLQEMISIWSNKLPIHEDFNNLSDYVMFQDQNFILVMNGLGLFNTKSIKKEFLNKSDIFINNANYIIDNQKNNDRLLKTVGHKNFINIIKSYF